MEGIMKDTISSQAMLQGLIDCYLETNPFEVLNQWADDGWNLDPNADADESCLKYLALIILDAFENSARKIVLEMGCPGLVVTEEGEHMLPAASESILARGLEMLREMCGMEGARAQSTLALGIRNDSLELKIEKSEALHIIHFPEY
jgi:hypothetical protein